MTTLEKTLNLSSKFKNLNLSIVYERTERSRFAYESGEITPYNDAVEYQLLKKFMVCSSYFLYGEEFTDVKEFYWSFEEKYFDLKPGEIMMINYFVIQNFVAVYKVNEDNIDTLVALTKNMLTTAE